jgi:hypothetical protein
MSDATRASASYSFVIAGLVPAIHVFAASVDARHKAGHDVSGFVVAVGGLGRIGR